MAALGDKRESMGHNEADKWIKTQSKCMTGETAWRVVIIGIVRLISLYHNLAKALVIFDN